MLLTNILFYLIMTGVHLAGADEVLQSMPDSSRIINLPQDPYVVSRDYWMYELGGGMAGFGFTRLSLIVLGFLMPDSEPRWMGTAFSITSTAIIAGATGAGTWWMGRFVGDQGSLGGAILGAALGEAAWLGIPELLARIPSDNLSKFDPGFIAYYSGMALPPLCALAGYKLVPPLGRKQSPSMGLMIEPRLVPNGAGVAVSFRF